MIVVHAIDPHVIGVVVKFSNIWKFRANDTYDYNRYTGNFSTALCKSGESQIIKSEPKSTEFCGVWDLLIKVI